MVGRLEMTRVLLCRLEIPFLQLLWLKFAKIVCVYAPAPPFFFCKKKILGKSGVICPGKSLGKYLQIFANPTVRRSCVFPTTNFLCPAA
jgi:hypothetical protein